MRHKDIIFLPEIRSPTKDDYVSIVDVTPRVSNPHDYVNHMFKRP
jgi:hypothetical protein